MSNQYDADYFLRGKQTGKSLYENYRWIPDLTLPMVRAIIDHLGIKSDDTILDFGCARGYTVKAFREMGYSAFGLDSSEWAIQNADPRVQDYVAMPVPGGPSIGDYVDWIIAKDVLEHVEDLDEVVEILMTGARKGVLAIVPLSDDGCREYIIPEYEQDVTHIHRLPLYQWADLFMTPGWSVEASYRVKGIKDNYAQHPRGNGFLTCRRLPQ